MKKILSVLISVLTLVIIGYITLEYYNSDPSVRQSVSQYVSGAKEVISSAVSQMSSKIAKEISDAKSGTNAAAGSDGSVSSPAIPVGTKITAEPDSGETQSDVSAPASDSDSQNVWGETGVNGLSVYEYGKTLLGDTEKVCYNKIAAAVRDVEGKVTVKTAISPEQLKKVYEYYLYDHSEVFYIDGVSLKYYNLGSNYTYEIGFSYKYSGDKSKITAMRSQLGKKALDMLKVTGGLSTDLKKEMALHDGLIEMCSYDTEAARNPDAYPDSCSAYGALVNGKAVCQGYAQAMKLLLSSAGIKSLYITGQADAGSHAWNIVKIGGKWRYLDATFDDPVFTDESGNYTSYNTVSYTYFNYTSSGDHIAGIFDSTDPFSATSENYGTMPKVS